jgi:virginiamycin B lyase
VTFILVLLGAFWLVIQPGAAAPPPIQVGVAAQFPPGSAPTGLIYGPESAFWFALGGANAIAAFTPPAITATLPLPVAAARPYDLVIGSGREIWFTEQAANQIGRLTLGTRQFTDYPLPNAAAFPAQIILGQDGGLWFTEFEGNRIARIAADGSLTSYELPNPGSRPLGIASDTNGDLWFTEWGGFRIGRLTTAGSLTEYTIASPISRPSAITLGPDGAMWFTYEFGPFVGRIAANGAIQTFSLITQSTALFDLAVGPDGKLWFLGVASVGRFDASASDPANLTETAIPAVFESEGRSQIVAGPGNEMAFITANSQNVFTATVPGGASERDVQVFINDLPPVLLAGGEFTVTAEIHNWSSSAANGVQIVLPLDTDINFNRLLIPSGSAGCTTLNQTVTCPLGNLPASSSLPLTVTLEALRTSPYPADRRFDMRVTLQENDFQPANNRSFRDVQVASVLEYANDFSLGSDAHWLPTQTYKTQSGLSYLGMFDGDVVTFNWNDLPPHDSVDICFDLYILGGWDGSASQEPAAFSPASNFIGPDLWSFYLDERRMLVSSFSNRAVLRQSFPDPYNEGNHPAQDAVLGIGDFDDAPVVTDARYHLCQTLSHAEKSLTARFNGVNLNERLDEKWALDNVHVRVFYQAAFDWLYLPLLIR